jgi:DNA polymerase-3 subunit delta'
VALLTGPAGVGKQRLGLWIAQGLLCEQGPGMPCDACSSCHQVRQLGHPDCHWFVPIPRPKASDPDKQTEEAAAAIAQIMEERRKTGIWERPDGTAAHGLASVRLLNKRVWITPFSGNRKVFILGDAERLIVQEASQEAANALLKVLEEPPADTTILVTAADPHALLPTIRSRLVAIRVGRVTDDEVRTFAQAELKADEADDVRERRILLAEGCAGRLLQANAEDGEGLGRSAEHLLAAVRKRKRAWLPQALRQPAWSARGDFTGLLDALTVRLRAEIARSGGSATDLRPRLQALKRVEEARVAARGNVNPQLTLAALASDLERIL